MRDEILDVAASAVRRLPDLRGKGRIAYELFRRVPASGDWDVRMKRGHRMRVPRSVLQGWGVAFTGRYDDDVFDLVRPWIVPGSDVLDVGASVGFWSLNLALGTPAGCVHAFEPVPGNLEVLTGNIERNDAGDRVRTHAYGLGAIAGEVVVNVEEGGVGNASVAPERADLGFMRASPAVSVPLRRLDDVDLGGTRCTFVKIDVEGFELDVLAGGETFITRHRPVILGEFDPAWMRSRGLADNAAEEWARQHDYESFEVDFRHRNPLAPGKPELRPLWGGDRRGSGNLLLLP